MLEMYEQMLLIQPIRSESGIVPASTVLRDMVIGGFCHLYIGQEAVVVVRSVTKPNGYRCHPRIAIMVSMQELVRDGKPMASWPSSPVAARRMLPRQGGR